MPTPSHIICNDWYLMRGGLMNSDDHLHVYTSVSEIHVYLFRLPNYVWHGWGIAYRCVSLLLWLVETSPPPYSMIWAISITKLVWSTHKPLHMSHFLDRSLSVLATSPMSQKVETITWLFGIYEYDDSELVPEIPTCPFKYVPLKQWKPITISHPKTHSQMSIDRYYVRNLSLMRTPNCPYMIQGLS